MPSRSEWRRRILQVLGDEGVDVELTNAQLDAAVNRALELWAKYRPMKKWFPFQIPPGETYVISFFDEPEQSDSRRFPVSSIRNVVDVTFQDPHESYGSTRLSYLDNTYMQWGLQGPRLWFQFEVAEHTYNRLSGARPDWHWDPDERKLYVYNPSRTKNAMVLATRPRLPEEITAGREGDFLKAATAASKTMLARVLGSMGEIPGPAGPITTDASELRSEAKEEWREVEEELKLAMSSWPPPRWIG